MRHGTSVKIVKAGDNMNVVGKVIGWQHGCFGKVLTVQPTDGGAPIVIDQCNVEQVSK